MIPKNKELPTELDVSLFVKHGILVQHLSVEIGSQRKFIVRSDLLQTGGNSHMTNAFLVIQILVKRTSLKLVIDKKRVIL